MKLASVLYRYKKEEPTKRLLNPSSGYLLGNAHENRQHAGRYTANMRPGTPVWTLASCNLA